VDIIDREELIGLLVEALMRDAAFAAAFASRDCRRRRRITC